MRAKRWLTLFCILTAAVFLCAGALVIWVDPFFHYHAPRADRYFYTIDNERSMNDGILRHFDYDTIITGTSLAACFRTSELDALFGVHSVKIPASGASYYEIDKLINTGLETHPEIKYVFRSLDRHLLLYGADTLRDDLGKYPDYLYDRNPLNDYKYLFNADVLFNRTLPMLLSDDAPGHTSFDDYSNTMKEYEGAFGLPDILDFFRYDLDAVGGPIHLSEALRENVVKKVRQNVIATAEAHPDVTFYCFFTPVSLGWWHDRIAIGDIYAQIEAEQLACEMMLQCPNIRLYDFTGRTDIISDVNQYRDLMHYGEWINSLMLKWMRGDQYRLTEDNYRDFFAERLAWYLSADYEALVTQERYHCDYYAAALLNEELTGAVPRKISDDELEDGVLSRASLEPDPETGALVLRCSGTLWRGAEQDLAAYLQSDGYIGLRLSLPDAGTYSYLCFRGRNTGMNGQPAVFVYDENGVCLSSMEKSWRELEGGWQIFAVDLRTVKGPAEVVIHGGYPDETGHPASSFEFKDFTLY